MRRIRYIPADTYVGTYILMLEWFNRDGYALLVGAIVVVAWVESVKLLAHAQLLQAWQRRKLLHIFTGPLFIFTWPLFSDNMSGACSASLLPLGMTLKFLLVGLGWLKDDDTVLSASRTGKSSELLKGPCLYGTIFLLSTLLFWKSIQAVLCLLILCFGDGFAEIIGRRFGDGNRLFWSPKKSLAGYAAFVASSTISIYLMISYFGIYIFPLHELQRYESNLLYRVLFDSILAGLVESLPVEDIDNLMVFLGAIGADILFIKLFAI